MAFNKDSTLGTVSVVTGLCLACSIVVSVAAVGLRSTQQENKALDKQSNILAVAGVDVSEVAKRDLAKLYGEKIEARLVDLATGDFVDGDADNFDTKQAAKDPARSIRLAAADDKASLRQISKQIPVFFAKDAEGKIDSIVLPIYGQGLWSTMYAFVAVAADGQTIKGITYYDHGETPGLGGEIENPAWQALFKDKKLFDQSGMPALRVIKGHAPAGSEHEIDGLSGATLTGNGVQHTFDFWMGPKGFGPFLAKVRAGEINNG
ncbi:Na(+)-translocating NADH-quinone reductase subunit C [Aeromonas veronii]|uniref:Na(+)-translocating NADH-quinone reductase subunit C n=1 Tax=Aeromonas veronii TaxID=654 RepID=UPI002441DB0C|nr:Na(+)-translocating NADH-quinone reductase subunit C [Aeromonas veronii]